MRCTECDYPLWNLTARECPECGTPFNPSAFEFVPNAVAFCCPGCDQPYYGTGATGHLQPLEFDCITCGRHVHQDEMVLRPAQGIEERQTHLDRMPWLERAQRGRIRSFFATIGQSMVAPHRLMGGVPHDSGLLDAWIFTIVTWVLIWVCGAGAPLMIAGIVIIAMGDTSDGTQMVAVGAGVAAGWIVASLLHMVMWGLVTHAVLKISGGCTASIGRTFQALCYSSGANAIIAIPCLGPYCGQWIGGVWHIVSAVFMVMTAQRVTGGRATLAVLVWPVTLVLLVVLAYGSLIVVGMTTAGRMGAMAQAAMPRVETTQVTQALRANALASGGVGPDHAALLMLDQGVSAQWFVIQSSDTDPALVPVADTNLQQIQFMPPNRRRAALRQAAADLGGEVIAHRLGDFVFVHHGIDVNVADPGLWLVIMSPDPDAGAHAALAGRITVGLADGTALTFEAAEFGPALVEQNALRRKSGLLPLPDPSLVTHDEPARP